MPTPLQHPSLKELTAFSHGQLSPTDAVLVENHIEGCGTCCETLLSLSSDDTFVGLLRQTSGAEELSEQWEDNEAIPPSLVNHPRYNVIGLLARGGMGDVFQAEHRSMGRIVALKVINKKLVRDPEVVERFQREVRTAARLSHVNIVTAYDAEQSDELHILVMEYVDGLNLASLVKGCGPLPVSDACDYARQAAVGLQFAHEQGIVHRDIKPHNLMLASGTVKILDFGLASLTAETVGTRSDAAFSDGSLTAAGSVMGTPDFISPEQAQNAHRADIRSDIYSLGATLYYLLCGRAPFSSGSVAERLKDHAETVSLAIHTLRPEVPQELSDIIARMLLKDPNQRFQTPQQVATALAPFAVAAQPTTVLTASSNAGRSSRQRSWTLTWASAALALLVASVIYVQTDKGTLKIESADDSVKVTITQDPDGAGGSQLSATFIDTLTGTEVKRLPSGEYQVDLGEKKNEFEVDHDSFTLRRGETVVVKVTRSEAREGSVANAAKDAQPTSPPKALSKMSLPEHAQQTLMMQGNRLSEEAAKALQATADADPSDVESRLQLLGYYWQKTIFTPAAREPHLKLVCWVVENYPQSEAAAVPESQVNAGIDPKSYSKVRALWLKTVEDHPENSEILGNAAHFFLLPERDLSEELLKKAQTIDPKNPQWAQDLGQLYQLSSNDPRSEENGREFSEKALMQFELALKLKGALKVNSYELGYLAKAAFNAGANDKAKGYAERLIQTGDQGEGVHNGNLILGRVALRAGDADDAGKYLLLAGKSTGSPSLSSFGPNMSLAKELLEQGQQDVVLEYLDLCGKFWLDPKLNQWMTTIRAGGAPDFGGNLSY